MARFRWLGVVGATLLMVVGCSSSQSPQSEVQTVVPPEDPAPTSSLAPATGEPLDAPASGVAHIQTNEGLLTVDLASGKSTFVDGLVNADWTRVASVDKGVAKLVDAESREEVRTANVPDGLHVAAISADGRFVAYSDSPEYGIRGLPKARTSTRVAIVAANSTAPPKVLDLAGNIVPEAFSTDGRALFVLDYVPAAAPDHYEVRMIDVSTGAKTDVGGRPKELVEDEQMQGNVRTSLYSPNRQMLFTLYSKYGEEGKAFIHALNLQEKWSYCIDLPDSGRFGDGQATLAMSDDKLYVLGDSGQIAEVDVQPYGLTVERSVQLPTATPARTRPTATVAGSRLIVGHENRVFFVDRITLRVDKSVTLTGPVVGLTADGHGRVAIATPAAIEVFEQPAHTRLGGFDMKLPTPIVRFDLE